MLISGLEPGNVSSSEGVGQSVGFSPAKFRTRGRRSRNSTQTLHKGNAPAVEIGAALAPGHIRWLRRALNVHLIPTEAKDRPSLLCRLSHRHYGRRFGGGKAYGHGGGNGGSNGGGYGKKK
jgi:hypothetical protein